MNKNIDVKNLKTAKKYARALIEGTYECTDSVNEDLKTIDEALFQNEDFKIFFSHPIVSLSDKKDTLKEALYDKVNQKVFNFIEILLDENRLPLFRTIFELYKDECDKIKNRQKVQIISAVQLDDELKEKLNLKLSAKLNKEVILNYKENKDIIAGLIIKYEDKILDLSLKSKINALKKN